MFLGYREYDLGRAMTAGAAGRPRHRARLPPPRRQGSDPFATRPAENRAKARNFTALALAKVDSRSTVYRRASTWTTSRSASSGRDGGPAGERRFLGLYTQSAYTESITRIPVLRRKLDEC